MVKPGYKQSEIGVIPEDWEVVELGKLYNITSSKRVFQSEWRKSGIPFYRAREIAVMSEGYSAPEDLYIDEALYNTYIRQYGAIKKDDVLITGVGTLGKVYVVKEHDRFYFKDGNIIWLQTQGIFSSQYLKQQYNMPIMVNQVFGNAGGSTVATYTITNAKATKVAVPPRSEQERIAEALSDVDDLIFSLEKLIEKYKSIKVTCLQQMFPQKGETTPKMRLPGFTGAWEQRKLGEVAKYRNGKAHENCIDDNGKYIVVNSKFVSTDGEVKKYSNLQNEALYKNEIAFVLSDVPNGRAIARTFLVEKSDKYTLNQRIAGITPLSETYPYYLYILMNRHPYFLSFDDGAKQTNLSVSDVMEFESFYPEFEEQKQIGKFFERLDNLITLHQRKLNKTKKIKQGMMQQLLTGKIRLV